MTLRYAWRSLAKSPGFVAIAVVALGMGLGLSAMMFAVLDSIKHPYSAYRDVKSLYTINWWFNTRFPLSGNEFYRVIRDEARSFTDVVPFGTVQGTLRLPGGDEATWMATVTRRYFDVVGLEPVQGRLFNDGEEGVAVVGEPLWQRLFGKRTSLTGATVTVDSMTYAIVGVMPAGAGGIWIPAPPTVETGLGGEGRMRPLVRLREGVTYDQADSELKTLAKLLTDRFGLQNAPVGINLFPLVWQRDEIKDVHVAMMGAALIVLLLACGNLAHLMLARGLAKRSEFAMRMALGASRGAVVRQMLAECAIVTAGGLALGALIAVWGGGLLRSRMPPYVDWVGLVRPHLSWRVFALAGLAAAVSAVLFGLIPAVRVALGVDMNEPLKEGGSTTTGRVRHRYNALVISEVALALVVLMGGGLLLRTVRELQQYDLGVDTRTLYRMEHGSRGRATDPAAANREREAMQVIARGAPGVVDIAPYWARGLPGNGITAERDGDSVRMINARSVLITAPSYLSLIGLPILKGRNFEPGDAVGSGVAIIDPVAAQRLYPNRDPVGRMLKLGGPRVADAPWVRIVGVVRGERSHESRDRFTPEPQVYVARAESTVAQGMLVRLAEPNPRFTVQLLARLRAASIRSYWLRNYEVQRTAELLSRRFLANVFVLMGVIALALAALGLYGVLAYTVSRRMREFAVRVALGAEPPVLRRLVLHDGTVMLLAGTGVGAFVALAANRLLDRVLVSILPSDVISLVLAEAVLLAVGFAAALAPARRATRANPIDIMRAV